MQVDFYWSLQTSGPIFPFTRHDFVHLCNWLSPRNFGPLSGLAEVPLGNHGDIVMYLPH